MLNKKQIDSFLERAGFDKEKGRETMDALRAKGMKIKRQLDDDGLYKNIDDSVIETIVMSMEIRDRAFMSIVQDGVMVWANSEQTFKQKNGAVSTFQQMAKIIFDMAKKLGMSPLDRQELNIAKEDKDGFDD